jgi:plastocyanin
VTITGTGFVNGATISIGGAAATSVGVASATSITATTPAHAAGVVDIVVTNPDGQSGRMTGGFTYETPSTPPPSVSAVAPASGPVAGGTVVTITGGGFAAGASVSFGGTAASAVAINGDTSITATAPARSAGSVDLVVTNPDGQSGRLNGGYTYTGTTQPPQPPPTPVAPTVTGISPTSATTAGGTAVTVTGTGFAAGATVSFGGTAASNVVVSSATSITTTTPAHAAGAVDVVVTNSNGTSGRLNGGFTYSAPTPPPTPPSTVTVITITSAGVTPFEVTISPGARVRFVNNDTLPHTIASDPHLSHTDCPALNVVGYLGPGDSRETTAFTTIRTCGYHDHNDPEDPRWTGLIRIR